DLVQAIAVALSAWSGGVVAVALTLLVLHVFYFPVGYYFLVRPLLGKCWREYVANLTPALVGSVIMYCTVKLALVPLHHVQTAHWVIAALIAIGAVTYLVSFQAF